MQINSSSNVSFESRFIFPKNRTVGGIFTKETAKQLASSFPYVKSKFSWSEITIDTGYANLGGNPNDISTFNFILKRFFGRTDFVNTVSQIVSKAKKLGIEYTPTKPNKKPVHDFYGRMGDDRWGIPKRFDHEYFDVKRPFRN